MLILRVFGLFSKLTMVYVVVERNALFLGFLVWMWVLEVLVFSFFVFSGGF